MPNDGSVYVYDRQTTPPITNPWVYNTTLMPSDGGDGFFGHDVALESNYILVGDPGGEVLTSKGSAYLYYFPDSISSPIETKYVASDGMVGDSFGAAVDILNETIAISAPLASNGGKVYLKSTTDTSFEVTIEDSNILYGSEVLLKANNLLIGSPEPENIMGLTMEGEVHWYQLSHNYYPTFYKTLKASDGSGTNDFGISIAYSEDKILIGAFTDNNSKGSEAGASYYFNGDLIMYSGFE
jgi:hypothetical protein